MPISLEERRRLMRVLDDLQDEWRRVFGEELARGFVIGIAQVPLIERCLRERSQTSLNEYIQGLDPNRDY